MLTKEKRKLKDFTEVFYELTTKAHSSLHEWDREEVHTEMVSTLEQLNKDITLTQIKNHFKSRRDFKSMCCLFEINMLVTKYVNLFNNI